MLKYLKCAHLKVLYCSLLNWLPFCRYRQHCDQSCGSPQTAWSPGGEHHCSDFVLHPRRSGSMLNLRLLPQYWTRRDLVLITNVTVAPHFFSCAFCCEDSPFPENPYLWNPQSGSYPLWPEIFWNRLNLGHSSFLLCWFYLGRKHVCITNGSPVYTSQTWYDLSDTVCAYFWFVQFFNIISVSVCGMKF